MSTVKRPRIGARSSTLVVAASDSSAKGKGQADYVCPGVADEVTIQAAIDALPSGGGEVSFLEGIYNIAATINITGDRVALRGMGGGTVLEAQGAITVFQLGDASNQSDRIYIGHMKLDGNTVTGNIGINLYDATRSGFEELEITGFRQWAIDAEYNHSLIINRCWIWTNGVSDEVNGMPYAGAIKVGDDTRDVPFNAIRIIESIIEWGYDGIWVFGGTSTTIRDSVIEGCNRHGIALDQFGSSNYLPQNVIIDGCYFEENNQGTIANTGDIYTDETTYNLTINGCYFADTAVTWCVRVGSGGSFQHLTFTNNRFSDGSSTNLYLNDGTDVTIGGNHFTSSLYFLNCKGVSPLDISQFSDADDCFTSIENSTTYADGLMAYVPYGTWTLSEKFTFPDKDIKVFGDGEGCTLKTGNSLNDNILYATGKSSLEIRNLEIDGNRDNNAGADPILLDAATDCTIQNVFVHDADDNGIQISGASSGVRVMDCRIVDCDAAGISIRGDDNLVAGNTIRTCTTPIDIVNSDSDRTVVMGNDWYGCTNDLGDAGTNSRITSNIDKNGNQYLVDDNLVLVKTWVKHDAQNPSVATVPAGSFVRIAGVFTKEAWNADGTDLLTVGYDADVDSLLTSYDLAGGGTGWQDISGNIGAENGYMATARAIELYYTTSDATNLTTGETLVVLEVTRCLAP